ncbi:MAG: sensor histidine kinase [Bacteroidota bacterium]
MNRQKKIITIVIVLSAVAVMGLVSVQVQLLRNAAQQKEEAFERTVTNVLSSVAARLETGETVSKMVGLAVRVPDPASLGLLELHEENVVKNDSLAVSFTKRRMHSAPLKVTGNRLSYTVSSPQHVRISAYDMIGREDTVIVDTFKWSGEYEATLDSSKFGDGAYFYRYSTDSASFVMQVENGKFNNVIHPSATDADRRQMVSIVLDKLALAEREPVERRIKPELLDSLLAVTLHEAGINMDYVYGVLSQPGDSIRMANASQYEGELKSTPFKTRLFPLDIFSARSDLALFFPGHNMYLLKEIGLLLGLTVLFLGIIIVCFIYTIRTIFKQKHFHGLLVDFINNMTHEFKTPISTIALASEAIGRPEILLQSDKVIRYNTIIQDENVRMRHQVDKILQMAVLEEGDYELHVESIDLHAVIRKAVENIALQVEGRGGNINCRLHADAPVIQGDAVHIANIIHNILDNANKYSPDQPQIMVETRAVENGVEVSIQDSGIGMTPEEVGRVFEKYYRVPTGNTHDVKGFGLGLSYVKLMVDAHSGSVTIRSTRGAGTNVRLWFPHGLKENGKEETA